MPLTILPSLSQHLKLTRDITDKKKHFLDIKQFTFSIILYIKSSYCLHLDDTDENQCKICNIVLSTQDYLIKHNSRFHGIKQSISDVVNGRKIGDLSLEKNVYVCSASGGSCALEFMTSKSYITHMKKVSQIDRQIAIQIDSYMYR